MVLLSHTLIYLRFYTFIISKYIEFNSFLRLLTSFKSLMICRLVILKACYIETLHLWKKYQLEILDWYQRANFLFHKLADDKQQSTVFEGIRSSDCR